MADLRVLPEQRSDQERAGAIPKLSGDLRGLIPKLGLRNYWYPAIPARRVRRGIPQQVKMMGEDICFFRGLDGHVVAIHDVCPHRGARLSKGHCHWKGTVTCPYHGWVFDERGKNVVVLGEGPDSKVAGKQGTEARVYPTRTLKNVVFVWIGDEEPAAIEEDVPEEFFDPRFHIFFNDQIVWNTSWEVALENSMDAHVNYLHRDHLQSMLANPLHMSRGASGSKIAFTGNGFRSLVGFGKSPPQDEYANGWKWPKHRFRRYWAWFFSPFFSLTRVPSPPVTSNERWSMGHRLPGMFRAGAAPPPRPGAKPMRMRGGGLFGQYTRQPVALAEWRSRVWYFHKTEPKNRFQLFLYWLSFWTIYRWLVEYNFSQQDMSVMEHQNWEAPEKLSGTDAEVIQWRRLVVTKHLGGRRATFEYRSTEDSSENDAVLVAY